ncbi:MAG: hypothetical protein JWO31_1933, partial [Phycisphaerales bacterium]|nr:hypothetical protein [Phycisphaerales bacterium]
MTTMTATEPEARPLTAADSGRVAPANRPPDGPRPRRAAKPLPIGIDVGTRAVRAIQVAGETGPGGRPRIVAALARPRQGTGPMSVGETAALVAALTAAGFVGRAAVLAAAPADTMVGPLELPPRASGAPLDQLARMELARNFRCAP